MKVGLIYCAYNTRDYISPSLWPWVNIQYQKDSPKITICAVNVRFAQFDAEPEDGTREILRGYLKRGEIDHLIDGPDGMTETEARGAALKWLVKQGVTHLWQLDSDEIYTIEQIKNIVAFVEANPFIVAHRISFKNLIFDGRSWLAEPFTPMRIHAVDSRSSCIATSFWDDNNVLYEGAVTGRKVRDIEMANMTIPSSVAFVRHASWLSNDRSRRKIAYQKSRGWKCSFSWDDSQGGLIFNPSLPRPKTITES